MEYTTYSAGVVQSVGISDVLVGVVSSSVTFWLTTVVCFIVGFTSDHVGTKLIKCAKRSRTDSVNSSTTDYNMATNPVYDDIMPQERKKRINNFELQENIAYY